MWMRWVPVALFACSAPPTPKVVPPASPAVTRAVDVGGVRVEVVSFAGGRYANRTDLSVQATREGTTRESTTARSSFVLTFSAGSVTGCRGQRVASYVDGKSTSHETRYQEQQGYRGTWKADDLWIDVELKPDNLVCPQLRRFVDLEPRPWGFRCLSVERAGLLKDPGLVCRVTTSAQSQFNEEYAHTLTKILPGSWIAFGPGNGLHATWNEEGIGLFTEKNAVVRVAPSVTPVTSTTWEKD